MRRVVIIKVQVINTFFTLCIFGDLQTKQYLCSMNSISNNIYKRLGKRSIISRIEKVNKYNKELEKINCKNSIKEIKNFLSGYKILNIYEQYI